MAGFPLGISRRQVWGGSVAVLLVAVLANFTSASARYMISPMVPLITGDFGISNSQMGLALTLMWLVFAMIQFPSGVVSDRFGERRIIVLALILIGSGALLLSVAPSFVVFAGVLLLIGLGSGLYIVAATAFLTRKFEKTGAVLGAHVAGPATAGLITPPVAAAIAVRTDWRIGVLVGVAIATPVLALFVWQTTNTPAIRPDVRMRDQFKPAELRALVLNRGLMFTMAVAIMSYFVFQAVISFFPTFLVEYWGFSVEAAGIAFSFLFFLRALGNPILGRLSDSFGRDLVIAASMILAPIGFGILLLDNSFVSIVVGTGFVGFGLAYSGVITSRFMDTLSAADRGRGYGLANSIANMVGSLGSVVTGTLAVTYGWESSIIVLIVCLMGAFTLVTLNYLNTTFDLIGGNAT